MNSPSSIVCSDKKNFYFHILIALKVDFENDKNDFDKNDFDKNDKFLRLLYNCRYFCIS